MHASRKKALAALLAAGFAGSCPASSMTELADATERIHRLSAEKAEMDLKVAIAEKRAQLVRNSVARPDGGLPQVTGLMALGQGRTVYLMTDGVFTPYKIGQRLAGGWTIAGINPTGVTLSGRGKSRMVPVAFSGTLPGALPAGEVAQGWPALPVATRKGEISDGRR